MGAAALFAALALSGPNGLQVLHNPATELSQQQMMVERLGGASDVGPRSPPTPPRRGDAQPTPGELRAAAWRADHLTCLSLKGRTRQQYQAECGAWAAETAGAR